MTSGIRRVTRSTARPAPACREPSGLFQQTFRTPRALSALAACLPVAATPANAHVKWFAEYDLNKPPLPVGEVLNGQFVSFFLGSLVLIAVFFWVDRSLRRGRVLEDALARLTVSETTSFLILRGATFIFFAAVAIYGLRGEGFFLTPELQTRLAWVPWLQAAIALCTLHRRLVPLTGLGMAILLGAAISRYGIFHLLDYLILFGVAYFFLASAMSGGRWTMSRYIVLFASTGLTLLWASIEKWGYPQWTYPLFDRDPGLLMGMDPRTYMVLAGFVEFNITYMLLSSTSPLSRLVALGFASIFTLAIYKFGMIDAVGHLLIIAILFVLAVRGPTEGRNILALDQKSIATEVYFMMGNYIFYFVLVFLAYYGLHYLTYGR